jgi:Putative prokaryotic signal transducing protein
MNAVHVGAQVLCLVTAPNPVQAHIWENALRVEGIRSQVVGDFLGLGIGSISGIQPEIWVTRQDFIRAKRVLRQCSQSEVSDSSENTSCQPGDLS